MPTKAELVGAIGSLLVQAGAGYASAGARDKHYGIWIFSVTFNEALTGLGASLHGLRPGPEAMFRGNPSDFNSSTVYTYARVRGARHDWELHVDANIVGVSGATHGVDVSLVADRVADDARRQMRPPRLAKQGLGVEAKCFGTALAPNEGRVALGFQVEMDSTFWLVANKRNAAVETMLRKSGGRTDFFGDAKPRSLVEADLRRAVAAHLNT